MSTPTSTFSRLKASLEDRFTELQSCPSDVSVESSVVSLLEEIWSTTGITAAILKSTGIGILMNNIRKTDIHCPKINEQAKKILDTWKSAVANSISNKPQNAQNSPHTPTHTLTPSTSVAAHSSASIMQVTSTVNGTSTKRTLPIEVIEITNGSEHSPHHDEHSHIQKKLKDSNGSSIPASSSSPVASVSKNDLSSPHDATSSSSSSSSSTPTRTATGASLPPSSSVAGDSSRTPVLGKYRDEFRNKAQQLLRSAFSSNGHPDSESDCMAFEIEAALFAKHSDPHGDPKSGSKHSKYREKLRSLKLNLANKDSDELRTKLLCGAMSVSELVNAETVDLAPSGMKEERRIALADLEAIRRSDVTHLSVTEMFTCGKCKCTKSYFYQMQTRRADEPMTTFCRCMKCGNRWRC